jgi:agmatine/peptidylarginine deiminase
MKKSLIYSVLIVSFLFGISNNLFSQQKPREKRLTHHMSPEEKALFYTVGKDYVATDPPPGEIRNIAEFDKMEGVLIRYPFGISYDVIAAMSEETIVTTIVENQSEQNSVTAQYQSHSVNMDNVNFLIAPSDSYWTRDYGPWYVAYGDDEIGIIDFIYNRPNRPNDNAVPPAVANFLGIEWFGMDLISAGGNYMTDGLGNSSSSELVWEENPTLTHTEISEMVDEYLGVNNYMVIPDPNNTYIDHIDCWGKFLDVNKVLIREVPESHPQYDEIEATAAYYAGQTTAWGGNYEVFRVWTPGNEPYTNSLILNDRVFVPVTGSQWDDEAIAAYQEAMPGYDVVGLTGSWESTDALHCRTKGIADRNTLFIKHMPLLANQPELDDYLIEAEITAYSGQSIDNNSVKVFYRVNSGSYEEIGMAYQGDKLYSASIPGQDFGSQIEYYIEASDATGNTGRHPFIGSPDPHDFFVGEQLFANINVDVAEINTSASVNNTSIEEFVIANTGQIDLNYSIGWNTSISEDFNYSVDNSPYAYSYESNTYTEMDWTDLTVSTQGEIANCKIDFTWVTDQYPEEGAFLVESPQGTQATVVAGVTDGTYSIGLDAFNGEDMQGNWKLWITDDYGDGGHQATNITITISKNVELEEWLSVEPVSGTISPNNDNVIEVSCDATGLEIGIYEGMITVVSNDPENPEIEIPVHFTVNAATGLETIQANEIMVSNYPNPVHDEMNFNITIPVQEFILLEIYNSNGQKVTTLINESLTAGEHVIKWNSTQNLDLKSGVYFYKLTAGNESFDGKIVLMR